MSPAWNVDVGRAPIVGQSRAIFVRRTLDWPRKEKTRLLKFWAEAGTLAPVECVISEMVVSPGAIPSSGTHSAVVAVAVDHALA